MAPHCTWSVPMTCCPYGTQDSKKSRRNSMFPDASRMVLPRYRAPNVAPPYFVPVDTANCRTFLKFGSCGLFLRQKIYFAVAFTAGFVGFPTFYCDRIAQQNQRNKENCVKKICSCRAPTRPKLSHFSLRVQTGNPWVQALEN